METTDIPYRIGAKYKYLKHDKIYILDRVEGWKFIFKCGKWVSDCVFPDLVDIEKGMQVYQIMYMTIKF